MNLKYYNYGREHTCSVESLVLERLNDDRPDRLDELYAVQCKQNEMIAKIVDLLAERGFINAERLQELVYGYPAYTDVELV